MKKTFKTLALITTIGLTFASCQKEQIIPSQYVISEIAESHVIQYSVDGISYSVVINDQSAMTDFWLRMFALVREGHEVSVFDETRASSESLSKEVVTFTTKSEEEALAWSEMMTGLGYHVNITQKNGVYTCTAIR